MGDRSSGFVQALGCASNKGCHISPGGVKRGCASSFHPARSLGIPAWPLGGPTLCFYLPGRCSSSCRCMMPVMTPLVVNTSVVCASRQAALKRGGGAAGGQRNIHGRGHRGGAPACRSALSPYGGLIPTVHQCVATSGFMDMHAECACRYEALTSGTLPRSTGGRPDTASGPPGGRPIVSGSPGGRPIRGISVG